MNTLRKGWAYVVSVVLVGTAFLVFLTLGPKQVGACGSCGFDECLYDGSCYSNGACIQVGSKYQHCVYANGGCSWEAGCPQLGIPPG